MQIPHGKQHIFLPMGLQKYQMLAVTGTSRRYRVTFQRSVVRHCHRGYRCVLLPPCRACLQLQLLTRDVGHGTVRVAEIENSAGKFHICADAGKQ